MGITFQQIIIRNDSQIFLDRYENLFENSTTGFSVYASLRTRRRFTNLTGREVGDRFTGHAFKFCPFPDHRTGNLSRLFTRPTDQDKRTYSSNRKPQWRCCDPGATETSPTSASFEILGLGSKGDSSVAAPPEEVSLARRGQIDLGNCYVEEAESGIRRVHIVENVPGGSREGRVTSSSSPISVEAPSECLDRPKLQDVESTESDRAVRTEKDDTELRDPSVQSSASSATDTESETAETASPDKDDLPQKVEWAFSQVQEHVLSNAAKSGVLEVVDGEEKSLLREMRDIFLFAGPLLGVWLSGPIMSLIDTAVVGNSSSIELAALGPGTLFIDQLGYIFMFLSVATANLTATALAKQDKDEVANHLSRLLFVALACGIGMVLLTLTFSQQVLQAFIGPQNASLVSAANSYVQIRGLAWPAALVGLVAQSACLGMQDSWNPFKVLTLASVVNFFGDVLLCTFLGYGIAGAAWATMFSQCIGCYLMLKAIEEKGYDPLALCIPSPGELRLMIDIAAPVLLTMLSKVLFYALITFLSTSLGAVVLAAHQVMIGVYSTFTVSGEPLAQTAQAFMPFLIQGANRNLRKAKKLLRSLLMIGGLDGVFLACFGICFPWIFPQIFTNDKAIIDQMRAITVPFLCSLVITPPLLSLEGTLLAGRDLQFLSLSMTLCFVGGAVLLVVCKALGFGLQGLWWILALFQLMRFVTASARLRSAKSVFKDSPPATEQRSPQPKLA